MNIKMIVPKEEILKYIPQRQPFVMIDSLVNVEDDTVSSLFEIPVENPMVKEGYFRESGLIENIAQTAAAGVGYECISNNKPVVIGFIGSVKNLNTYRLPKPGDTLETNVKTISKIMNATIIKGVVKASGRTLLECEMNIFLQDR